MAGASPAIPAATKVVFTSPGMTSDLNGFYAYGSLLGQLLAGAAGSFGASDAANVSTVQALLASVTAGGTLTGYMANGTDDTTSIQSLINLGGAELQPGLYKITAPLVVVPYSAVTGPVRTTAVSEANYGAVIQPQAGFTSSAAPVSSVVNAVFALLSESQGGYSTASEEQKIAHIMVDGSVAPSGVCGMASYGSVSRVRMTDVLFSQMPGDGVQHNVASGAQPDSWTCFRVFSRYCGGIGFSLRSADSTWSGCLSTNSGAIGWFINTCGNSLFESCRSEHSGTLGWGYVCSNNAASSGGTMFVGCRTDQSTQHGFQAGGTINSVVSFTHAVPLLFVGCHFKRDGANGSAGGGGYAGFYNANYGGVITIAGLTIWPGVNDTTATAASPSTGQDITTIASWSFPAAGSLAVTAVTGQATSGDLSVATSTGFATLSYTGLDTTNHYFTGCALLTGTGLVSTTSGGVTSVPGPQIGLLADGGSQMTVDSAYIQGYVTAVTDNSGGGISWGTTVVTATGPTTSPVITLTPYLAVLHAASLTLSPAAAPAADPFLIISANSGERAFGMKVTGDSSDRVKWTSDGVLHLGPGPTTQDWSLGHNGTAAAIISGALAITGKLTAQLVAAPLSFTPGNPTGTISTTDVMAGFGSTVTYTPGSSGRCLIIVNGESNTATNVTLVDVGGYYGVAANLTIAAGSNGGTISAIASWSSPSAGVLDVSTLPAGFPASGTVYVAASGSTTAVVTYTGVAGGNQLTGCAYVSGSASGTVATGGAVTTVPPNGVPVTGTRYGPTSDYQPRGSGISNQTEWGMNDILYLTAGLDYWFDNAFSTGSGADQANLRNVCYSLAELS
jgi:hypothetical protein